MAVETTSTRNESVVATAISSLNESILDLFHETIDKNVEQGNNLDQLDYEDILSSVLETMLGLGSTFNTLSTVITKGLDASNISLAIQDLNGRIANIEGAVWLSPTENILSVLKDIQHGLKIDSGLGKTIFDDILLLLTYQSAIMLKSTTLRGNISNPVLRVNTLLNTIRKMKDEAATSVIEDEEMSTSIESTSSALLEIMDILRGKEENTIFSKGIQEAILNGIVRNANEGLTSNIDNSSLTTDLSSRVSSTVISFGGFGSNSMNSVLDSLLYLFNFIELNKEAFTSNYSNLLQGAIGDIESVLGIAATINKSAEEFKKVGKSMIVIRTRLPLLINLLGSNGFKKVFEKLDELSASPSVAKGAKNIELVASIAENMNKLNTELANIPKNYAMALMGMKLFSAEISLLTPIIEKCAALNAGGGLKNALEAIEGLSEIIKTSTACLAIGGLFMMIPNMFDAVTKFAFTLGLYVTYMLVIGTLVSFFMRGNAFEGIESLGRFLVLATAALSIGGLFMMIPNMPEAVMLFSTLLSAFTISLLVPYAIASFFVSDGMEIADGFARLIAITAGAMLIGGLFMYIPRMALHVMQFSELLTRFIVSIIVPYGLVSIFIGENENAMSGLALLVGVAALCMVAGPALMKLLKLTYADIDMFAEALISFVDKITIGSALALWLASSGAGDAMRGLAVVVGVGALCMVAGPGLMKLFGITYEEVKLFTDKLSEFVSDMCVVFGLFNMMSSLTTNIGLVNVASNPLIGFSLAVATCAATMVLGPYYMVKLFGSSDVAYAELEKFCTKLLEFVIDFSFIFGLIGAFSEFVDAGSIAVAGIELVVWGFIKLVEEYADAVKLILNVFADGSANEAIDMFGDSMMHMMTAFGKIMAYLFGATDEKGNSTGLLNSLVGLVASPAIIVMLESTIAVVGTMGMAVKSMGAAIKEIQGVVKDESFDPEKTSKTIKDVIMAVLTPIQEIMDDPMTRDWFIEDTLFSSRTPASRVADVIFKFGTIISNIAEGVKTFATSSVPIWENGKKIGERGFTEDDFTNCGNFISDIISVIGASIFGGDINEKHFEGVVNLHSDWFESGFFGQDSIGLNVVDCVSKMGGIVSNIASGVLDFANLSIPQYDASGKEIGRLEIKDKTKFFNEVVSNVQSIISVIGASIFGGTVNGQKVEGLIHGENAEWFEGDFFGDGSDGKRVMDVVTQMSQLVGNVAMGVQSFYDLKIPIEYGDDGKPKKFIPVNGNINLVKQLIIDIMTCTFSAMDSVITKIKTYKFDDDDLEDIGDTLDLINENMAKVAKIYDNTLGKLKNFKSSDYNLTEFGLAYDLYINIIESASTRLSSLPSLQAFNNHKNVMTEYVKTINTINVQKISQLNQLVKSIGQITNNTKNLNNFNTMIQKLANVLDVLTIELRKSYLYINKNEEIHKQRAKVIDSSISLIKTILDTPLSILIDSSGAESSSGDTQGSSAQSTATSTSNKEEGTLDKIKEGVNDFLGRLGIGSGANDNRGELLTTQ